MDNLALTMITVGFAIGMAGCVDESWPEHPGINTLEYEVLNTPEHPEYPDINAPPAASDLSQVPMESLLGPVTAGAIVSPISAAINNGGPGFGSISHTLNQSGLTSGFTSGVTNFDMYLATTPRHTMFFSGFEWFSNHGTTGAEVTYDLGASITIDRLALWNEESSGIGTLNLLSSEDGATFTPLASGLHPTDNPITNPIDSPPYPAEVFDFTPTSARFVRLVASDCPQPNPGDFPAAAIGEVAFRVAACGVYSDGRNEADNSGYDLDQAHHMGERSPDVVFYDLIGGQSGALTDFHVGFFAGTLLESTSDDNALYNHFVSGNGSRLNFATSSDMARIIGGAPAFTKFADGFERRIKKRIDTTGTLCGFDGDGYIQKHAPKYFHKPLFTWAVMGGYYRIEAEVKQTASNITIKYRIYDHFGAGVSDAWSYLLGLSAMYYLQHFHGVWGTSYTPFIWSVEIERTIP